MSHLSVHVVNRLLRENRKSIPKFLSGKKLFKKCCKHYMIPCHCDHFCCCASFGIKNINVTTRFDQIHPLFHKILSMNIILKSIKGHNSVENICKLLRMQSVISVNGYCKFCVGVLQPSQQQGHVKLVS